MIQYSIRKKNWNFCLVPWSSFTFEYTWIRKHTNHYQGPQKRFFVCLPSTPWRYTVKLIQPQLYESIHESRIVLAHAVLTAENMLFIWFFSIKKSWFYIQKKLLADLALKRWQYRFTQRKGNFHEMFLKSEKVLFFFCKSFLYLEINLGNKYNMNVKIS